MSAQRSPRGSVGASAPQTHHIYTGNVRPISDAELRSLLGEGGLTHVTWSRPLEIDLWAAERIQREPDPRPRATLEFICIAVALLSLAYFVVRVVA